MATTKTSEAKAKVGLDSAGFEKGAKAVIDAANAMSSAVKAAMATAGIAILAAFGAETVSSIIDSVKSVLTLGESMANAGKRAGIAAGQFYLFNAAVEKGLGMKTVAGLIGENAEVLNHSANIFRDVSIKLWAIGEKIRGFWLGLMDRVAPVLSRILDGSLGASLVSAGEWFGQKIADGAAVIYELAKDGKLWDTLTAGLKVAFAYLGERLLWAAKLGYTILKEAFSGAFNDGIKSGMASVWESIKSFVIGIGEALEKGVGDALPSALGGRREEAQELEKKRASYAQAIIKDQQAINDARARKGIHATKSPEMVEAFISARSASMLENQREYGKLAQNQNAPQFISPSVTGVLEKIVTLFDSKESEFQTSPELAKLIEDFRNTVSGSLAAYKRDETNTPTKTFENNTRQAAFGADSLTSIGGGGGVYLGLSVLDVNKAQLDQLRQINQKLGNQGSTSIQNVANYATQGAISRVASTSVVSGVAFGAVSAMAHAISQ